VLMLLLAMLVPFTMGNHELTRGVPSQPAPRTESLTETPDVTEPVAVATALASSTEASNLAGGNMPPTLPEPDLGR
ncbi:MAG: hypothetical protein K8J31_19065, partial [Anaerolineae bacterium]|nr:hypothetical protein [Anaerolineae bacterium]